ncbi:hypothetical protein, partial [Salmonella sp. s51228]|uniref:hypothetical protein n=1 Tax=Salmonella sp. s51228 TaxID=3159652 RepID=UPI00398153C5
MNEQIVTQKAKISLHDEMTADYNTLKREFQNLSQEKEFDDTRFKDILERNTQLEIELQHLIRDSAAESPLDKSSNSNSLESELTK